MARGVHTLLGGRRVFAHPASSSLKSLLIVGAVLVTLVLGFVLWFALARPLKVVPRIRPAPAFTLIAEDGSWLSSSDLSGRAMLLNFDYTACTACAEERARLRAVRDSLVAAGKLGSEVGMVTISIDPARDTPETLRAYAASAGLDASNWRLLTGHPSEVRALVGGEFGVYYAPPAADGTIVHDERVMLIDGNGILRAEYTSAKFTPLRVVRDLDLLKDELSSDGMMRQVYEASHLLLCYPD